MLTLCLSLLLMITNSQITDKKEEVMKFELIQLPYAKFNDSLEDAKRFCEVLHDVGSNQCQLLPFHQFGENKYYLLNKKYAYENQPALHCEDLQEYLQIFLDNDIHAFF